MKGIYLGAFKAFHPGYQIVYQDINGKRDLPGDMMDVNLEYYDFVIATPPCNYWSRACGNRHSDYAIKTAHLLPGILRKLVSQDKPFIVENVRIYKKFEQLGLFNLSCFVYFIGRHTYWTNIMLPGCIEQRQDFTQHGWVIKYDDMNNKDHQGGFNVHNVIETWLDIVHTLNGVSKEV